ncbi:MAG: C40 family peptidase [Promicromonosporaceae bacterium]|nr:C40 family peptidase [Promicromonosporaceae bacterium]
MPTLTPSNTAAADPAAAAIAYARSKIGKPYVWGAAGPNSFDCSGLTSAAYGSAGVTLPHFTGAQIVMGTAVAQKDLQPGDLVFPTVSHVQLYTGGGNIIEAPQAGENVVERAMWGFTTARRVVKPTTATTAAAPGGTTSSDGTDPNRPDGPTYMGFNVGGVLYDVEKWSIANGLRLLFVITGAGLVVLGLARMVVPAVQKAAQSAAPIAGAALL